MHSMLLRWFYVFGLAAVLLVNALAVIHPINGKTVGEISAMFPVGITPAPYAFSIWGLIYTLLIGFVVVQFIPRVRDQEFVRGMGPWFLVSCFLTSAGFYCGSTSISYPLSTPCSACFCHFCSSTCIPAGGAARRIL